MTTHTAPTPGAQKLLLGLPMLASGIGLLGLSEQPVSALFCICVGLFALVDAATADPNDDE